MQIINVIEFWGPILKTDDSVETINETWRQLVNKSSELDIGHWHSIKYNNIKRRFINQFKVNK